jgi:hypothetical protein
MLVSNQEYLSHFLSLLPRQDEHSHRIGGMETLAIRSYMPCQTNPDLLSHRAIRQISNTITFATDIATSSMGTLK